VKWGGGGGAVLFFLNFWGKLASENNFFKNKRRIDKGNGE